MRYDRQYMKNLAAFDAGNPDAQGLLPPIDFKGNDAGGFSWNTFEPRLGVTYALGEKRQTLLRGTFSRYAEQLGQLPLATRVNPIGYNYAYFYFEDANHNLVLDPNEVGLAAVRLHLQHRPQQPRRPFPTSTTPTSRPTLTDELTFGVDQGFGADLAAGVTVTYRNIFDIPEAADAGRRRAPGQTRVATRDDYVQVGTVTGTLPNGQTVDQARTTTCATA